MLRFLWLEILVQKKWNSWWLKSGISCVLHNNEWTIHLLIHLSTHSLVQRLSMCFIYKFHAFKIYIQHLQTNSVCYKRQIAWHSKSAYGYHMIYLFRDGTRDMLNANIFGFKFSVSVVLPALTLRTNLISREFHQSSTLFSLSHLRFGTIQIIYMFDCRDSFQLRLQ